MREAEFLSCVVVDDEFPAVKLIADYVQKTIGLKLLLQTTSGIEALNFLRDNQVDLLFTDVQMPELNGMELLNIIKNKPTKVIITTAYPDYAVKGFEHDAIDYLLKPITLERFLISAEKAQIRINSEKALASPDNTLPPAHIFVKTEYRIQRITLASILYIEAMGDYIVIYTTGEKILSLERMKNIEEILPSTSFLRIHKSYIINIGQIDFIERGRIIINNEYLPVGDSYKEKVKAKLNI